MKIEKEVMFFDIVDKDGNLKKVRTYYINDLPTLEARDDLAYQVYHSREMRLKIMGVIPNQKPGVRYQFTISFTIFV